MVETTNRRKLRSQVIHFHEKTLKDSYFNGIPSLEKVGHYFHAKNDHPEIRAAFFQFLRSLDNFQCYFVIGHKNPRQFISEFEKSSSRFYFHTVRQLINLPVFNPTDMSHFYLSRRNQTTNERFNQVLEDALCQEMYEEQLSYKAEIVKSAEYPELWIIDYMLWAVQRCLSKGEKRFLYALSDKVFLIQETGNSKYKEPPRRYKVADFLKQELTI